MKIIVPAGTTSKLIRVFIQDTSRTDGEGITGINSSSPGLLWYWSKVGDTSPTPVSPTSTGTIGTWVSGWIKELDATNMRGVVELGLPNASLAGGDVHMELRGAANMAPVLIEIQTTKVAATLAAGDIATDAIDANALKADAVTEIQAGLSTATVTNAIKAKTDLIPAVPATEGNVSSVGTTANAIKLKTDLIPAVPATEGNVSSVGAAVTALGGPIVTPPTAAAIRTEMDANSTKLASLDATISSRAAPGAKMDIVDAPSATGKAALASANAAANWNALLTAYVTAGTFGNYVQGITGGGGGGGASVSDIVTAMLVDGLTNKIKVNSDGTINIGVNSYIVGQTGTAGIATGCELHSGLYNMPTVTATLYPDGSSTASATGVVCFTDGRPGVYLFNNPSSLTGMQNVFMYSNGASLPFASGWADFSKAGVVKCFDFPIQSAGSQSTGLIDGFTPTGLTAFQAAIANRTVNVVSPLVVTADGVPTIAIVAGDDYYTTDGRAITFPPLVGTWPSWVGAVATVEFGGTTFPATITTGTGSSRVISFDLTTANTTALGLLAAESNDRSILFDLIVTLSNGHRTTVINSGVMVVATSN